MIPKSSLIFCNSSVVELQYVSYHFAARASEILNSAAASNKLPSKTLFERASATHPAAVVSPARDWLTPFNSTRGYVYSVTKSTQGLGVLACKSVSIESSWAKYAIAVLSFQPSNLLRILSFPVYTIGLMPHFSVLNDIFWILYSESNENVISEIGSLKPKPDSGLKEYPLSLRNFVKSL